MLDREEPARVAEAVRLMNIRHAVITSVNRDELPDGGAEIFAETIRRVREARPGVTVEVLIPDFQGVWWALDRVIQAHPDILNHNTETVPRLYTGGPSTGQVCALSGTDPPCSPSRDAHQEWPDARSR